MPYKSVAQERYFNANKGKIESQGVDVGDWNASSKGMNLPYKLKSESHSYDQVRPKSPLVSRYSK